MWKKTYSVSIFLLLGMSMQASSLIPSSVTPSILGVQQEVGFCRGMVKDAQGQPIIGASVLVKGTSKGTSTKTNGEFTLSKVDKGSTLLVSCIGFLKKEVKWEGKPLTITLEEDKKTLEEAVVVAYGTAHKNDLTGSLTAMKPDGQDAMKTTSIDGLLNGKVAGLVVNTASANPGAASSITIRGASSLRGDNQPLFVIDNIPQASTGEFASSGISGDFQIAQDPLASLNPADIENITVLKDASATAIYGSRGANGVILITTKKGKVGKATVAASATFTLASPSRLINMINLREYATYRNSRISKPEDYNFHFVDNQVYYTYNPGSYNLTDPTTYQILQERNWQKEIYRSALSQNYSLSVNGGNEQISYYLSANFKNINGTVKQTGLVQGDFRTNFSFKLNPKLSLKLILAGSLRQNNMMAGGNTLGGATGAISRTALDYAPFEMTQDDPNFTNENATTIFSWLNDYVDIANDKTFNGSLDLNYTFNSNWKYNLRTGGNLNMNDRKRWYGLQLYQGMNNQGYLAVSDLNKANYSIENLVIFNKKVGANSTFEATGGVTYDKYTFLNKNIIGTQFAIMSLRENGMHIAGSREIKQPIQKDYQLLSYLGRVNFNLFGKYLLTASLRADGSSKFAKGNRWGYFPAASIAWRMNEEDFLKDQKWLNQLKLRLSYGVTGNQSINPYSTFAMYAGGGIIYADPMGNALNTMTVTNLANNGLKWEKTASWNLGVDFGILNSRISGSIDIYQKKTTDLLISKGLPGSAGFYSTYYNQGALNNKGVEFALNARILDQKDWKWSMSGNIGVNRSKIEDLGLLPYDFGYLGSRVGYLGNSLGDHFGVAHIFLAGEEPGLFYGYQTKGIVQTNDVDPTLGIKYYKKDGTIGYYKTIEGSKVVAGDVNFVDQNEDGVIDIKDKTIIGNPNPDFTYGFQTSLSWKEFTLSATFAGVKGRDILNVGNRYINTPGIRSNNITANAFKNMWTPENPSNLFPSSTYQVQNIIMDRYVEDGSYFRCSDLTLSYTIPKVVLHKMGIKTASIFATVKNAFLITSYNGYDPEVNSFAFDGLRPGVDMNSYPTPRSFLLGLNLSF